MYNCIYCNYETSDRSNFFHHNKTKKHLKNTSENSINNILNEKNKKDIFECLFCNKIFSQKSNLSRHKKECQYENRNNKNLEEKIIKLTIENEKIKLEKQKETEIKEIYSNLLKEAGNMVNNTTKLANKNAELANTAQNISLSAIAYANKYFNNAPVLETINNFKINNLDYENKEEDKIKLIENLIYYAKNDCLEKLLGDHIIKDYKKNNSGQQSFYSTDVSRLSYIVRKLKEASQLNNNCAKEEWETDKKGIEICKSIIVPLIKKCIEILSDYQKELLLELNRDPINFSAENRETVISIIDVMKKMELGQLEIEINKYIAPHFNLKK